MVADTRRQKFFHCFHYYDSLQVVYYVFQIKFKLFLCYFFEFSDVNVQKFKSQIIYFFLYNNLTRKINPIVEISAADIEEDIFAAKNSYLWI
jgi:hypothetical protein